MTDLTDALRAAMEALGTQDAFCDAMQRKYEYRPDLWGDGKLMNRRDRDRLAGWMLALDAIAARARGGESDRG